MTDTKMLEAARAQFIIEERSGDVWQVFFGEKFVEEFESYNAAANWLDYWVPFMATFASEQVWERTRELTEFISDYIGTWKQAHPKGECARPLACLVCRGRNLVAVNVTEGDL